MTVKFRKNPYGGIGLGCIFFLAATTALISQEASLETSLRELPGLRERTLVMHIVSRIVGKNQEVEWEYENTRFTIPGRPVGLKLIGSNLVVVVQFTPFLRANDQHILVAQGQIWINVPEEGMRYHTTMQTIPLQFSEQIYFFPLGSVEAKDEARIEIQLMLEPYSGNEGVQPRRNRPPGAETNEAPGRRGSPPVRPPSVNTDRFDNETPP